MTDDEAKAIVLIVIEFLEKLDRMEIGDQFPNYMAGEWSRKNIQALVEDLRMGVEW